LNASPFVWDRHRMALPILAPLAALAALAAAALGYRWRQDIWNWLTRTPPPAAALGRLRVVVAGPTGIGKTTLIRHVLGSDVGVVGEGIPVTPGVEWLGRAGFPVWFADTKGIEVVTAERQVSDLGARLAAWPAEHRPHLAWLCVQSDAARVMAIEGELARVLHALGIPVVVVLTQAEPAGEMRAAMEARCRTVFPEARAIVAICAEPRTRDGRVLIPRHGLDALRRETLALAPEALRAATEQSWPEPAP
jgi:hypothetical protein